MQKITIQQAAFLYLLGFNIGESDQIDEYDLLVENIDLILKANNFPPLDEVIYDNEGEALINWAAFNNNEPFNYDYWLYKNSDALDDDDQPLNDYIYHALVQVLENSLSLIDNLNTIK